MQDFILVNPEDALYAKVEDTTDSLYAIIRDDADAVWVNDGGNPLGPIIITEDFESYFLWHLYDKGKKIDEIREVRPATPDTICLAWASATWSAQDDVDLMKEKIKLKWGEAKELADGRTVRSAPPTPEFWKLWRERKDEAKALGYGVSQFQGKWQVSEWTQPTR